MGSSVHCLSPVEGENAPRPPQCPPSRPPPSLCSAPLCSLSRSLPIVPPLNYFDVFLASFFVLVLVLALVFDRVLVVVFFLESVVLARAHVRDLFYCFLFLFIFLYP